MKTPIVSLDDTVANEAMCLDIGRRLGVTTARAEARRAEDRQCLLVERYDREAHAGEVVIRLHQEDFCQALGIPSNRKYQAEGGPTLEDCFELIRRASTVPARDVARLFDYILLSYLVANHDGHGKNFSLVYAKRDTSLAPAYDVLSTFVYRGALRLSRKMAMTIGTEYRPDYVRPRHFEAMIQSAQLGPAAARRRAADLAERAPIEAELARNALGEMGWEAPVLGRIVELVARRAAMLASLVTPTAAIVRDSSGDPRAAPERALAAIDSVTEPLTSLTGSTTQFLQRVRELRSVLEAAPDDRVQLQAAVQQLDASVEVVEDALAAFSGATWSLIDQLESGTIPGAERDQLIALWRRTASFWGELTEDSAQLATSIAESDLSKHPSFRVLVACLDRLSATRQTMKEWEARLKLLDAPARVTNQ